MTAILAAEQSQQLLKIKIPAVVLELFPIRLHSLRS
jgi:hypothetical protein